MMMKKLFVCSSLLMASVAGHGLVKFPKSRNQFCGQEIKPDRASGTKCDGVFDGDMQRGYNYMAVLNHHLGRAKVRPLPKNVCGFDSESWNGGATPWDRALDWPTNDMKSGRNKIVWNIETGPHFDDTDDFKYWITKPGFKFEVGKPLTWEDFEDEPFCSLYYDDKKPGANKDIVPNKADATFTTWCNVPKRSGRHVIYGEWGRRESTFERFHTCIDAKFDGTNAGTPPMPGATPHPTAATTPQPPMATSKPVEGPTPMPTEATPYPAGPCQGATIGVWDACHQAPNCCAAGLKCHHTNQYYSQCIPADKPAPTPHPQVKDTPAPPKYTPKPPTNGACDKALRKWSNCHMRFNCCEQGLKCHVVNPWYAQCL